MKSWPAQKKLLKKSQALHQNLRKGEINQEGEEYFNLKGVAYQGARETSRFWSRGRSPLELGLIWIHLVGVVGLESVVVLLLPFRLHVGLVGVVAGVAALLLLLDLVL
jgi:hypothetical protein